MATVKDIYLPEDLNEVRSRFEAKVSVDAETGCWHWNGCRNRQGYGRFNWPYPRQTVQAHRASAMIYRRLSADDLDVCHECDTPSCVNPDHLFVGTRTDNMSDAMTKGRTPLGSMKVQSLLTEGQVAEIRAAPEAYKLIAARFGISWRTVREIKHRRSWRHVA